MTREEYNETLGTKINDKLEEQLCSWNFCDTCINLRIRNKMPIPVLKEGEWPQYHRYIDPSIKPSGFIRKDLIKKR